MDCVIRPGITPQWTVSLGQGSPLNTPWGQDGGTGNRETPHGDRMGGLATGKHPMGTGWGYWQQGNTPWGQDGGTGNRGTPHGDKMGVLATGEHPMGTGWGYWQQGNTPEAGIIMVTPLYEHQPPEESVRIGDGEPISVPVESGDGGRYGLVEPAVQHSMGHHCDREHSDHHRTNQAGLQETEHLAE